MLKPTCPGCRIGGPLPGLLAREPTLLQLLPLPEAPPLAGDSVGCFWLPSVPLGPLRADSHQRQLAEESRHCPPPTSPPLPALLGQGLKKGQDWSWRPFHKDTLHPFPPRTCNLVPGLLLGLLGQQSGSLSLAEGLNVNRSQRKTRGEKPYLHRCGQALGPWAPCTLERSALFGVLSSVGAYSQENSCFSFISLADIQCGFLTFFQF